MSTSALELQPTRASRLTRWLWFALGFVAMVVVSGRMTAPSDLFGHDQPKTVAYSVDMALHGRYVLPTDTAGRPASKPPMTNWLAQPTVAGLGITDEWSLRSPALFGGLAVLIILMWMAHGMSRRQQGEETIPTPAMQVALLAGLIWLASYPASKLLYLARPDPPLCAFLLGGWACATQLLLGNDSKRRWPWALGFWLCVAAAALTKGPAALLPIIYLIVAAPMLTGRFAPLLQSGWWWGLPLAVGLFGAWAALAYQADPTHFRQTFLGVEVLNRFSHVDNESSTGAHQILMTAWKLPVWFLIRFAPWSLLAIGWFWPRLMERFSKAHQATGAKNKLAQLFQPMRGPMAPAALWCILVLVFFSCIAWKRADYLMPLYPTAALVVAHGLLSRRPKVGAAPVVVMGLACVVGLGVTAYWHAFSMAAKTGHGRHVQAFARQVQTHTQGEPILFEKSGYNGLQSLLGHHQTHSPTQSERRRARWIIRPIQNKQDLARALVASDKIIDRGDRLLHLGLFRPVGRPNVKPLE